MRVELFPAIMLFAVLIIPSAYAMIPMGSLVVSINPEKDLFESGDIPALVGTVTDQGSKPVGNATVTVNTANGAFAVMTDKEGKFRYQYPSAVQPAEYLVKVKAQKDGYGVGLSSTTFFVSGVPKSHTQQSNFTTVSGNNVTQDPVAAKILKNIAIAKNLQAEQDAKIKQTEEEQKFIDNQRALANQQEQIDLQSWFAQFNPFTPRNAYAAFVSQVNQTVQAIFWGQFNFTEQKTNEGLAAMDSVLSNGGTNDQARAAFIQNASSTKSEIVQVNKDLNIKYGHADKDVQAKFDKYGNIPGH